MDSSATIIPVGCWHCAFTKPRQEEFAQLHLRRQDIETFFPKIRVRKAKGNDIQWVVGPLFPRYLFVRPANQLALSRIRSTLGVASLVSFGSNPAVVPEEVVVSIRERCAEENIVVPDETVFHPGEKVRVIAGPFEGMNAIFCQETSQQERVVILLNIMASVAKIKIDPQYLVSATDLD